MSTKPRKFWLKCVKGTIAEHDRIVSDRALGVDCYSRNQVVMSNINLPMIDTETVHVIEYSAYQALEQKLAVAQEEISRFHWRFSDLYQNVFKHKGNVSPEYLVNEVTLLYLRISKALALINPDKGDM